MFSRIIFIKPFFKFHKNLIIARCPPHEEQHLLVTGTFLNVVIKFLYVTCCFYALKCNKLAVRNCAIINYDIILLKIIILIIVKELTVMHSIQHYSCCCSAITVHSPSIDLIVKFVNKLTLNCLTTICSL